MGSKEVSGCLEDANCWPPGFRFHPTDEELVLYYLKKKICGKRLKLDIVAETDVYKWDPEELPGQSKLKSGDRLWFFFSPRDRKYPNGARSNRATRYGYWKATGKDRIITYITRSVGVKKTLVFYKGRAPSGERTDWVMHEYTLDEEELKRCQSARDYYALYKVFKKSGPGPKNGEQYGAPFKEEDWADDECLNVNDHVHVENSVEQVTNVDLVDTIRTNSQVGSLLNDLKEFMNGTLDEPLPVQPLVVDYAYAHAPHEAQGTMVDPFLGDLNLSERSIVIHPRSQQYDVQTSFDVTQSTTSQLPLSEAREVTSATNIHGLQSCGTEEDFLEDFLEMDDLLGPEPTAQGVQNHVENFQLEELDGLFEFDLFHDAAPLFLNDVDPVNAVSVSDPCSTNIENGLVNPASHSYFNNFETAMAPINPVSVLDPWLDNLENVMVNPASHSYLNNLGNGMVNPVSYLNNLENDIVNQLDYQLQSHSNDACCSGTSSQLWTHDESSSVFTPAEPNHMTIPQPIPGVLYADNSTNLPFGASRIQNQIQNQNRNDKEDDSWISSALWSFVESIPTTPASASESALVNRAFDRISSFRRLRINGLNTDVAAATGNPAAATERNSGNYNRGPFYFFVLGVVCAILWILIGTSVKVLGRFISS